MPEKNDVLEKALNRNYSKVQKEEIKVINGNTKLAKDFSTNTVNLLKTLNTEMKEHTKLDKEIKTKYEKSLKELNDKHLTHTKDIEKRVKAFEVEYQNNLKVTLDKYNFNNKELDKMVEQVNAENVKLIATVLTQYETDIASSEAKKVQIEENGEKDVNQLLSNLKDTQDKHEALVANLNEKRDDKKEKLNAAYIKKTDKYNSEIEKETLKIEKSIADLVPSFQDKLHDYETKLADEKEKYLKKESSIKSALESRVARHEKFLNKATAQRDNRSIKEHKKNIIGLQKETEKELKLLAKEHNDRYSNLNSKKVDLISTNKNKIAVLESDLVKVKEEKLYQIEFCTATLKDDLQISTLTSKQTLEDELNKYNEFYAENDVKQAEVIKLKDINLEKQEDIQVNLKTAFDNTNQTNEVKNQETLSKKDNDYLGTNRTKLSEETLSKLVLDVELAKLESEGKVSLKELVQSIRLNEENELIEHHNNDFSKLSSINNEYLNHQQELTSLYNNRANDTLVYEEIEINNRIDLKVAFLNNQKGLLTKDYEGIVNKINQVFESEKQMYDLEIKNLAEKALDDLAAFELESNDEINTMVEKRNAFNPKAYKKEIKVLDKEIEDKKETLSKELNSRKSKINNKTALFNKAVAQTQARKEKALKEVDVLNNNEQTRLDNSIELLTKQKENELSNMKDRSVSTNNDSNNFYVQAQDRNKVMTEENTSYQNSRVEKEETLIKEVKATFEQDKHTLTNELEQVLVNIEKLKNESISQTNEEKLKQEADLESKVRDFDSKIKRYNQVAENQKSDHGNTHKSKTNKIDAKYNNHLVKVSNELKVKADNYKTKTVEVDKATNEENKSFDAAKKQTQRNHDAALQKGLALIDQKLQQDLKNI